MIKNLENSWPEYLYLKGNVLCFNAETQRAMSTRLDMTTQALFQPFTHINKSPPLAWFPFQRLDTLLIRELQSRRWGAFHYY